MRNDVTVRGRGGFTLIEVLVTLILLAVLAAAIVPVVSKQSDKAEPVRVASDLAAIRSAVEAYRLDVRPSWPGDIEDLVFQPTGVAATDPDLNGDAPGHADRWRGPYIDLDVVENVTRLDTATVVRSGFDSAIKSDFVCLSAGVTLVAAPATDCAKGDMFAVQLEDVSAGEAEELERTIDNNSTLNVTGKFRHDGASTTGYYIVGPYY